MVVLLDKAEMGQWPSSTLGMGASCVNMHTGWDQTHGSNTILDNLADDAPSSLEGWFEHVFD